MGKSKTKVVFLAAAVVVAVVGALCFAIVFVGRQDGGKTGQIVADAGESDIFFDFDGDIAAEREAAGATCTVSVSNGTAVGFEMRFSKKEDLDTLLAGGENIYFACVDYGGGPVAIPMANIRILTDIETGEYVLTLVPEGEIKADRAAGSEVRFYVAPRDTDSAYALFMASAVCEKP